MKQLLTAVAVLTTGCWNFSNDLSKCNDSGVCQPSGGGGGGSGGGGSPGGGGTGAGTVDSGVPHVWTNVYAFTDNPSYIQAVHAVSPNEVWFSTTNDIALQWLSGTAREVDAMTDVHGITDDGTHVILSGYWTMEVGYITTVPIGHPYVTGDTLPDATTTGCGYLTVFRAGTATYAGGSNGCLTTGPTWASFDPPADALQGYTILAGAGVAADDFWVVSSNETDGILLHYSSNTWENPITSNTGLIGVAVTSNGDVVAVGLGGAVIHIAPDETMTRPETSGHIDWQGAFAIGPTDVMFVGDNESTGIHGTVGRWTGDDGNIAISYPVYYGLGAIHGTSGDDIWAGDYDGGIWHYAPAP